MFTDDDLDNVASGLLHRSEAAAMDGPAAALGFGLAVAGAFATAHTTIVPLPIAILHIAIGAADSSSLSDLQAMQRTAERGGPAFAWNDPDAGRRLRACLMWRAEIDSALASIG